MGKPVKFSDRVDVNAHGVSPGCHLQVVQGDAGWEDACSYDKDIQASESLDPFEYCNAHAVAVGHVDLEAEPLCALERVRDVVRTVPADHAGTGPQQRRGARAPDARCRTRDQCDLPRERESLVGHSDLRLLEFPVFEVEDVAGGEGTVSAERLGTDD